jgi:hypothetical protein
MSKRRAKRPIGEKWPKSLDKMAVGNAATHAETLPLLPRAAIFA